jgi:hypothetical protein
MEHIISKLSANWTHCISIRLLLLQIAVAIRSEYCPSISSYTETQDRTFLEFLPVLVYGK